MYKKRFRKYKKKYSRFHRKKTISNIPRVLRPTPHRFDKTHGHFLLLGSFVMARLADVTNTTYFNMIPITFELKMIISFNSYYRDIAVFWSLINGNPFQWPNLDTRYAPTVSPGCILNGFENPASAFQVPANGVDALQNLTQYNPYTSHMDRYQSHWCYKMKLKWTPKCAAGTDFQSIYQLGNATQNTRMKYNLKCAFIPNGKFAATSTADSLPVLNALPGVRDDNPPLVYSRDYRPDLHWWDCSRNFTVVFKNPEKLHTIMCTDRMWSLQPSANFVHDDLGYLDIIWKITTMPQENSANANDVVNASFIDAGEFSITKYFIVGPPGYYKYNANRVNLADVHMI